MTNTYNRELNSVCTLDSVLIPKMARSTTRKRAKFAEKLAPPNTKSAYRDNRTGKTRRRKSSPNRAEVGARPLRLPELIKPEGPGYMPLYCAAQWVATRGGTLEINPLDEALWREAFKDLLNRIASDDVKVVGARHGVAEQISGIHFASCSVAYPFSEPRLDLILSEELFLVSYPYLDDEHWRGGFDDSLQDRSGVRWRRLMVLKSDIARCWPFALDYRTGAPGRPSAMHLVEEEHRARWARGEAHIKIGAEADYLLQWLAHTHPTMPRVTAKTIRNRLRREHRRQAEARK